MHTFAIFLVGLILGWVGSFMFRSLERGQLEDAYELEAEPELRRCADCEDFYPIENVTTVRTGPYELSSICSLCLEKITTEHRAKPKARTKKTIASP